MEAPNLLLAHSHRKLQPPFPSRSFPTKIKMKSQTPICSAKPSLCMSCPEWPQCCGERWSQRKVFLLQQAVEASSWCQHDRHATFRLCPKCQQWSAGSGSAWTAPGCRARSAGAGLRQKRKGSQSDKHEWKKQPDIHGSKQTPGSTKGSCACAPVPVLAFLFPLEHTVRDGDTSRYATARHSMAWKGKAAFALCGPALSLSHKEETCACFNLLDLSLVSCIPVYKPALVKANPDKFSFVLYWMSVSP